MSIHFSEIHSRKAPPKGGGVTMVGDVSGVAGTLPTRASADAGMDGLPAR